MLIFTFNKHIMLNFAVKLNCLVKISMCLDGCVNCFESNYITLEKSVKSITKIESEFEQPTCTII